MTKNYSNKATWIMISYTSAKWQKKQLQRTGNFSQVGRNEGFFYNLQYLKEINKILLSVIVK